MRCGFGLGLAFVTASLASGCIIGGECVDCIDPVGRLDAPGCCGTIGRIAQGAPGQLWWLPVGTADYSVADPVPLTPPEGTQDGGTTDAGAPPEELAYSAVVEFVTPKQIGVRIPDLPAGIYITEAWGGVAIGEPRAEVQNFGDLELDFVIQERTVCVSTCDNYPGQPLPTVSYPAATITFSQALDYDVVAINIWDTEDDTSEEGLMGSPRVVDMTPIEDSSNEGIPQVNTSDGTIVFRVPEGAGLLRAQLIDLATGTVGNLAEETYGN